MMRNIIICLFVCFAAFPLAAGKFEDFCDEFEFIRNNLFGKGGSDVQSSANRQAFLTRAQKAGADAAAIQHCATELGIRNITLGDDFVMMSRYFSGLGGTSASSTHEIRWKFVNSINRQIQLLKNLKFNYEKRTFVRSENSGTGRMDALEKLDKKMQTLEKEVTKSKGYSSEMLDWFRKSYEEITSLALAIDRKARNDGLALASGYDLTLHIRQYMEGLTKYYEGKKNASSGTRNKNYSRERQRTQKGRKSGSQTYVYARNCIREDLKILKKAGFEMLVMDPPVVAPVRTSADASSRTSSEPRPPVLSKRASLPELIRELDARKEKVFRSESRMNGVSREYYNRYRALLTNSQARNMDEDFRKALEQKYSAELARSVAVLKAHTKYRGAQPGVTVQDIQTLLTKGE